MDSARVLAASALYEGRVHSSSPVVCGVYRVHIPADVWVCQQEHLMAAECVGAKVHEPKWCLGFQWRKLCKHKSVMVIFLSGWCNEIK